MVSKSTVLADPIIGLRAAVNVTDRLSLSVLGDIGGFGARLIGPGRRLEESNIAPRSTGRCVPGIERSRSTSKRPRSSSTP